MKRPRFCCKTPAVLFNSGYDIYGSVGRLHIVYSRDSGDWGSKMAAAPACLAFTQELQPFLFHYTTKKFRAVRAGLPKFLAYIYCALSRKILSFTEKLINFVFNLNFLYNVLLRLVF